MLDALNKYTYTYMDIGYNKWFWVPGVGQSKAVPDSDQEPIIPLFRALVTVMAKWLYIQPMAI